MLGLAGVTAIDARVAGVTVSWMAGEKMGPKIAVTLVTPIVTGVARPLVSAALLTVATDFWLEFQVASTVRSIVLLSEKLPVAFSCCVVPSGTLGFAGVIAMDVSATDVTVRVLLFTPLATLPRLAAMMVLPAAIEVASPEELIDATVPWLDAHVTCALMF